MKLILSFALFCSACLFGCVDSARILGLFFVPAISHQKTYQPVWRELSLRGHEVIISSPNVLKDPTLTNLTEIDAISSYEIFTKNDYIQKISSTSDLDNFQKRKYSHDTFLECILNQLEMEPFKKIINDKNRQFDLILIEAIHPLPFALGARFNAPVIVLSSLPPLTELHDSLGNPVHPVLNPEIFVHMDETPTFFQRLYSFLYNLRYRIYYNWFYVPKMDKLARKYFGDDIPYLGELEKNVSLVVTNRNPITHAIRPNVPRMIEVSQIHITKNNAPLPNDLKQFMDSAKEGVIYFSLGSNVRSSELSPQLRKAIIDALAELPYKVIWKWEEDKLPNQPKNVLIRKWLPQMSVLGHPNVKAFITQAGLQSLEEAIANEVPMITIPILADQFFNSLKLTELGMALTLDSHKFTKAEFLKSILEVAGNKKYKENVRKANQLIVDQPIGGLDKAIWWIEYVIRHGGTPHLRNPALDLPFYQYHLLDVLGFLFLIHVLLVVSIYKAVQLLRKQPRSKPKKLKSK